MIRSEAFHVLLGSLRFDETFIILIRLVIKIVLVTHKADSLQGHLVDVVANLLTTATRLFLASTVHIFIRAAKIWWLDQLLPVATPLR